MPPRFRTPRLLLRPVDPADADMLLAHWNAAEVRRHLWDDERVSRATVESVVRHSDEHFAAFGYGLWALRPPDEPRPVGVCGLRPLEGTDLVEIVYSLEPRFWGQGLATEAARAVLGHAFLELSLERVVGGADEPNLASVRVLERLGMRFFRELSVDGRPVPYYAITRQEFVTAPGSSVPPPPFRRFSGRWDGNKGFD